MLACIILFFPAAVMTAWNHRLSREKAGFKRAAAEWACCVVFLNLSVMAAAYLLFGSREGAVENINRHIGFAVRYLALSLTIAVAAPYIWRNRDRIEISVVKRDIAPEKRSHSGWLLYFYAFVLFVMNLTRCFDNVLWGDEAFSVLLVRKTIPEILYGTAIDVHPPLYYLFLFLFEKALGGGYHVASLITYGVVLTVGLTWVKKAFGGCQAALFITLASFLRHAAQYNVEIRMYSMASMFVLLAFMELYEILQKSRWRDYLLFMLFSLGAAYSHYYSLLTVAFFYLFLLWYALREKGARFKTGAIYIGTAAGYLPWLSVFIAALENKIHNSYWIDSYMSWKKCFYYLFDGTQPAILLAIYIAAVTAALIKEGGVFRVYGERVDGRQKIRIRLCEFKNSHFTLWVLAGQAALLGTMATGIIASALIRPVFLDRYLFPAAVIAWFVLSASLSRLRWKNAAALFLSAFIIYSQMFQFLDTYKQENRFKEQTAVMLEQTADLSPNAFLLSNIYHIDWMIFDYYYPGRAHALKKNTGDIREWDYGDDIWLFWSSELNGAALNEMKEAGYQAEAVHDGFLGVYRIFVYRLRK